MAAVWDMIRDERASLVEGLAELPEPRWTQPSLCGSWTTTDVVGHILATTYVTPPKFVVGLAASGFRFNTMQEKLLHEATSGKTPNELVGELRAQIPAQKSPPGPTMAMLGETIIHGEDIFRAGGAYREHPVLHVLAVADFFKRSNLLIGAKRRIEGVTLRATDTEWTHGSGPEVAGPILALVMVMTGRAAALGDVTGEGVEILRQRT
jgi:uncharacterized protein (TIGR03083 family)